MCPVLNPPSERKIRPKPKSVQHILDQSGCDSLELKGILHVQHMQKRGCALLNIMDGGFSKCLPGASSSDGGGTLAGVDTSQAGLLFCHGAGGTGATTLMQQIIRHSFCVPCWAASCLYTDCARCFARPLRAQSGLVRSSSASIAALAQLWRDAQISMNGRTHQGWCGRVTRLFKGGILLHMRDTQAGTASK